MARTGLTMLVSVASTLMLAPGALAQEAHKAPQPGAKEEASALQTVTVTAPLNKAFEVNAGAFGAKDPMDIPLSIQTYDAQAIMARSPRSPYEVLAMDPSISAASYGGGFDNFRLRGFAMDNFNTIRRDGLAMAPHHDAPLEGVERIDVLKGPSGFLYGFNSPGGTVNYLLKRPTREPLLNLSVQGSSLQGRYVALDSSASAFDGRLGYRINAAYEKNGDFDHARDLERKFVGMASDIRLSDTSLLQLNADWSWKSSAADPLLRADQRGRADPLDPATFRLPPQVDSRKLLTGSWFRHTTEGVNLDAKLEIKLSPQWTSVTQANHSRVERHGGFNDLFNIGTNGDIGYADLYVSRGEVFRSRSLQSYLSGKLTTGAMKHDMFFGASVNESRDKSPLWDFVESAGDIGIGQVSVGNILKPVQPARWDFGPEQAIDFYSRVKERSLFASDLITFNDHIDVLLGGRYIWYRAAQLSADALPQRKNVFVPAGALVVRPAPGLMSYLSFSRGFERGQYAPFYANNANQPGEAIKSTQAELGLKAELSTRLNVAAAAFDIRRNASYVDGSNDYVTKGEYRHRGIELNAAGRITRGFTATANAAYLHTRLEGVIDPTTLGKRSEGAPKWKSGVGARYAVGAAPGLSIDGLLSYVGQQAVDAQNSGFIPSFTLVDAGLSYAATVNGIPVTYRLHAKNLMNKYYYAGSYYQGGLELGRGREVFFSVQANLGR